VSLHVRTQVAGEAYALPVEDVVEVAELGDLVPVPGAAAAILGVRNLRGQVLPVIDLAGLLGVPRRNRPDHIVVAEHGGRRAGLAVDAIVGVESLPEASEEAESAHVIGAAVIDGSLVGLVDVGSVLDTAQGAS
jgi:chemotaxis signal transduction protein